MTDSVVALKEAIAALKAVEPAGTYGQYAAEVEDILRRFVADRAVAPDSPAQPR